MSGTSMDGLDVALCKISGTGLSTRVGLLEFETVDYTEVEKQRLKAVFSKEMVDLELLCVMNPWVGLRHAEMILTCLSKWSYEPEDVDFIASHGQTIYHGPKSLHGRSDYPNATLQIGDGDHVAVKTGIMTLSDFRQKHIAAGGEGAPLAVFGDYLIFASSDEDRMMLNLGGIANLTFLPRSMDALAVFSSDLGTGNTLMDAFIQQCRPGQYFDEGAALASQGSADARLLAELKEDVFFEQPMPKTTGPELFNLKYLERARIASGTMDLSDADIMATLNQFSADMIVDAIRGIAHGEERPTLYVSGGGAHNPLLMDNIKRQLHGYTIRTTADLGIDPDAKEAVLFAILANETLCGQRAAFGNSREGIPAVTMGKISFPD